VFIYYENSMRVARVVFRLASPTQMIASCEF